MKRFWDWAQRFEILWSLLQLIREQLWILLPAEGVVTWLSTQLGIPWPETLLIAINVAFWIIAWPLLGREAAKHQKHPPELYREKSDESPIEHGELQKLELDLTTANAETSIAKGERDEYKWQVEDKEKELSQLRDEYLKFKRDHGRWRIQACGRERGESLNLSVAILYIDYRDSELAEQIYGPFWPGMPLSPWVKTQRKRNILDFDNPSSKARVVIFSDHPNANGIKAAFNNCDLLGERVDRFDKSFADGNIPDVDIAIVVFPSVGKEE